MMARLRVAQQHGAPLRSNAMVIAQFCVTAKAARPSWPNCFARWMSARSDPRTARQAGVLLGLTGTSDPVDATVVLLASAGDRILTSDPGDLALLAEAAANRAVVVGC